MASRSAVVASAVGLHARPATLFVQAVTESGLPVKVGRPGLPGVDARSVLMVMSLGVKGGETVELTADGAGADEALDGLVELLAQELDEA